MNLTETNVDGVLLINVAPLKDARGFFARSFCSDILAKAGHPFKIAQENISFNTHVGTLRGLHYQAEPAGDPKIVRCERGKIWDVAVDLRPGSSTYLQWTGANLSAENVTAMLIPAGCAHGFISLKAATQVLYLMGEPYAPERARGVRWDDPTFKIDWPAAPSVMSDRDATYPDYKAI